MDLIHFEEVNEITSLWTSAGVVLKSMKYDFSTYEKAFTLSVSTVRHLV